MNRAVPKIVFILVLLSAFLVVGNVSAQLDFIEKITNPVTVNDTSSVNQKITIDNVNREIEYTDNLVVKSNVSDFTNDKQNSLILEVDSFNIFILKQGAEFKKIRGDQLSHFFLINAGYSWNEYYQTLRGYQKDLQTMIRDLQDQQSIYIKNSYRWKQSLPDLEKDLSPQIKSHINSNLKSINEISGNYDEMIRKLVSAENKIMRDIIYVGGILNDIKVLKERRKAELFKQNDKNIIAISYRNSYEGSFTDRLNLFYNESTKSFVYFYSTLKRNLPYYLIIVSIFIFLFYFVRNRYARLNIHEDNIGFYRINRIVIEKPALTIISIMLFLWGIFVPYSPLILNLLIFLSTLVLLLVILAPVMDPFIKKIEIAVIILLALSNLQIITWYYGSYSRWYLLFESLVGILLTYKYIIPWLKIKEFINQNRNLIVSIRIVTFFIFMFYSVSFVANIAGFINLTVYCLKLGVYTGVISLFVHGFYRISNSIFQAGISVINIYYPDIISKYGISINNGFNRLLKVILGILWLLTIARISELYDLFSSKIGAFLTDKIKIGSLTFSLGNILLFVFILYITFVITNFTKRILEREILVKHHLKRGMAGSISLTIRIIIVFLGTLLALSVSGLDLGKISLIAGALSVGIGFGLQNIVSNFISGLILVYEKPVQEGDTVEVDTLLGRVSNIGMRSSTITTYSGADVVVPNSNLISNQLINWTLSDNRRRIEIKVGTSYKSDPNVVLKLLYKAALSHPNVLRDPEPVALFDEFGDSSLNFRLLFWVHFDVGLITKSDVAVSIFNIFAENNVEIPFPQVDLHVKDINNPKPGEKENS